MQAYDFKSYALLADQLNTTASAISNRVSRNTMPADYMLQCTLETGTPLTWILTGQGSKEGQSFDLSTVKQRVKSYTLAAGKVTEDAALFLEDRLLTGIGEPLLVAHDGATYLTDLSFSDITNGKWLASIEGNVGIYDVSRIPVSQVLISGGDMLEPLKVAISDVTFIARVRMICTSV